MGRRRLLSCPPSLSPSIACSNSSFDVTTSITALLDLNCTDSTYAASLSHPSLTANTKIYKRVRWADGVNERIERTCEINDWIGKKYRERRATKRHAPLPTCLKARLRPDRTAVRAQGYLRRRRIKPLEAGILKRSGVEAGNGENEDNYEPRASKTTNIRKNGNRGRSEMQLSDDCVRRWNMNTVHHLRQPGSDPRPPLSAMRQPLSEHARDGTPLQKPDYNSYNIDPFPPSGILSWYYSSS